MCFTIFFLKKDKNKSTTQSKTQIYFGKCIYLWAEWAILFILLIYAIYPSPAPYPPTIWLAHWHLQMRDWPGGEGEGKKGNSPDHPYSYPSSILKHTTGQRSALETETVGNSFIFFLLYITTENSELTTRYKLAPLSVP